MQHKAVCLLFCKFILHVSGVNHTHHQEYLKLPPMWPTWPRWREAAAQLGHVGGGSCTKIWPVTEAVVTVLCTADDGCGWHPKHVEWTCRIINRLLSVASRWTVINPLNAELNPICHLLALLEAHHILHFSRIRVNIDVYTELGEVGSCESDMNLREP